MSSVDDRRGCAARAARIELLRLERNQPFRLVEIAGKDRPELAARRLSGGLR